MIVINSPLVNNLRMVGQIGKPGMETANDNIIRDMVPP